MTMEFFGRDVSDEFPLFQKLYPDFFEKCIDKSEVPGLIRSIEPDAVPEILFSIQRDATFYCMTLGEAWKIKDMPKVSQLVGSPWLPGVAVADYAQYKGTNYVRWYVNQFPACCGAITISNLQRNVNADPLMATALMYLTKSLLYKSGYTYGLAITANQPFFHSTFEKDKSNTLLTEDTSIRTKSNLKLWQIKTKPYDQPKK